MQHNISALQVLNIPAQLSFLAPIVRDDLIRLGYKGDGGYVLPKCVVDEADFLISLGVSSDWSFDADFLARNPKIGIHAYDHTISKGYFQERIAISFLRALRGKIPMRNTIENMRVLSEYKKFFQGEVKHYQERVYNRQDHHNDATIHIIFERINGAKKVFLKMDIEGGEYRVIDDLLHYSSQIIGMAIEFHDTDPLRLIFSNAVQKIQEFYEIVHVHMNNFGGISIDEVPEVMEIIFLRKDFCQSTKKRSKLPLENLDRACNPEAQDYILNFKN